MHENMPFKIGLSSIGFVGEFALHCGVVVCALESWSESRGFESYSVPQRPDSVSTFISLDPGVVNFSLHNMY